MNWGYNFQEQWQRAFDLNPPFVMVTGWNEWIAGRWGQAGGPVVFVDQYDEEFSRDIEPMSGGHGDNYYLQLVANVRRFKGAPALPHASPPFTIRIDQAADQWRTIEPVFADTVGDTAPRDHRGVLGLHYADRSGRNDLVECQVARDRQNLYFHVRTREPLTPCTDPNWMWLLIDADQNPATGWHGYDFIVNRSLEADGTAWLEKGIGGWNWQRVAKVNFRVEGAHLQLAFPRRVLGLKDDQTVAGFDFKWADNLQHPDDILDFYLSGDVAPEGRLNYRYAGD